MALGKLRGVKALQHGARVHAAIARRHKIKAWGECTFCDRERLAENDFYPSHDASTNCESGGKSHCSCDVCF